MFRSLKCLDSVQNGTKNPRVLVSNEITKRVTNLSLSAHRSIENKNFRVHVNAIELETVEGRYLLSGGTDGTICVHDLYNFSGEPRSSAKCVSKMKRPVGKVNCVNSLHWYPHDTGLFTSGSMDGTLKIWDTNTKDDVETIKFNGHIYQQQMVVKGGTHCLIAVATSMQQVFLVDLKTGTSVHQLQGHTKAVFTCHWSPRHEYILATGSADNRILLWDVRSPNNCFYSLDQQNGRGRSSAAQEKTAHNGSVNGLCFTEDGLQLVSFGTDHQLRLWDVTTGKNQNVNYGKITNSVKKCVKFAVSTGTRTPIVYVPTQKTVRSFYSDTGMACQVLSGHFEAINSCVYNQFTNELYSAGFDSNIVVWAYEPTCSDYKISKLTFSGRRGDDLLLPVYSFSPLAQPNNSTWDSSDSDD